MYVTADRGTVLPSGAGEARREDINDSQRPAQPSSALPQP